VAIKFAASLDGKIATKTGHSKWITNEKARVFARTLRSHYQAVLVGIKTILCDDPHLGVRIKGRKDPVRIILDSNLTIPLKSQVLRDDNVIIATTTKADQAKRRKLTDKGITLMEFDSQQIPLTKLLQALKSWGIISILVEGGGAVLGSFIDDKLIDKVYAFYGPLLIGGEQAVSAIGGQGPATLKEAYLLKDIQLKRFADNLMISGYL